MKTVFGRSRNISVPAISENLMYSLFVSSECRLQNVIWKGSPKFCLDPPRKLMPPPYAKETAGLCIFDRK